ncbi:ATP-binding cassette domain-containing protein [Sphingomonas sp. ID1715]|uniref:ABC transporter ATP-binding protein n=1 Tax=Sphingomonas sp. ID1715 TaxID=1656898 RepID=UPI001488BD43|nr:ATP-binding cassette domain-containing protein [Sphingomonas sp. ID1715]NNM75597.1 ATP-binding cassette domain-containing protein [Sphingomonas sp. ID1715]
MNDPAVTATGLRKSFGRKQAVAGLDLMAPRGSIYGVLGPNGAGKTTSLRILMGIIEPDAGERRVLGALRPREVSDRIGYLPEERGLYPSMKARDAIAFMGALRGLDWREGRRRGAEMLEATGLNVPPGEKIRNLSKGMAQLVQLIGSMVHRPDLLVLDEPFSGLDPVNQEKLEALIIGERDRGATVLFSTHVMAHAQRLCDRLAIIAGGERRFEGTVDEARALLPMQAQLTPRRDAPGTDTLLPPGAVRSGQAYLFDVPPEGIEPVLERLIASGQGVASLSVERPALHDVFVKLVREAGA